MSLVAPNIKPILFSNPEGTTLYLYDNTGLYSADNTGGYGLPGGLTTASVTTVTVTLNYTQLSSTLVYVFTIVSGAITAATISFASASPTSIFSQLTSTVWPFTIDVPFDLMKDYGIDLPTLYDMVYEVDYRVRGTYLANVFDYTAEYQVCFNWATYCCISKALINANMSDINPTEMSSPLISYGYMLTAIAANGDGDTTKSNNYLIKAKALCDEISDCGCGD